MEIEQFDALTRHLCAPGSSRRHALRALAGGLVGGALAGMATRLGVTEEADAKAKPRTAKAKSQKGTAGHQKRGHHPAATSPASHQSSGSVQTEGKHKKKKHKNPPPLPPGCRTCNECQMCQDGGCVPDPALERVRCSGSGAACGYCEGGACGPSDTSPCADGTCPQKGQCCADERWCSAPESPTGFYCVDKNVCCPDTEHKCADGSCIKREFCCKEQKRCGPTLCVAEHECCPAPDPSPCGECEQLVCAGGEWGCQATDTCGPPCFWGYCPRGYECYGYGVCCDPESGHCTCSSGTTGGEGCNGKCCPNGCSGTGCNP